MRAVVAWMFVVMMFAGCAETADPQEASLASGEDGAEKAARERFDAEQPPEDDEDAPAGGTTTSQDGPTRVPPKENRSVPGPDPAVPYTADDWLILPLSADENGTVASFRFTVPPGALHAPWCCDDAEAEDSLFLEVAPLLDGSPIKEVAFGWVDEDQKRWWMDGDTHAEGTLLYNGVSTNWGRPFYLEVRELEVAQEGHLVVAARGEGNMQFGVRILSGDPWEGEYEPPAEDEEAFLDRVSDQEGWILKPQMRGDGFSMSYHYSFWSPPFGAIYVTGGQAKVEDASIGAEGANVVGDLRVSAPDADGPGYMTGSAIYWSDLAAGEWSVEGAAHDLGSVDESGLMTHTPASPLLLGLPGYFAEADGPGPSGLSFRYQSAGDGADWRITLFTELHLGATLEDLTGVQVDDALHTFHLLPAPQEQHLQIGDVLVPRSWAPEFESAPWSS